MGKKVQFRVEVELPEDCSISMMKDYVWEAVQTNCGCLNPEEDPLFWLNKDSVKVTRLNKKKSVAPVAREWDSRENWDSQT